MVDPVAFDKASIELPAEARIARQHKVAVGQIWPVPDHLPEDRVAGGMKGLDIRTMRDRCQQVRRHLRLLMVGHFDAVDGCKGGHPSPGRRPAAPGRVIVC